jgi:carbonic anhydrase
MSDSSQFSRRDFVRMSASAVAAMAVGVRPLGLFADTPVGVKVALADVLPRLMQGNERFVKGTIEHPGRKPSDFQPLAAGQSPIAVILGCADSRVAPEILFDQGIGDLFVVRVAGNYVPGAGSAVKGSIEYAVAELGVQLIMVLGHSQCGAVKAAIKHIHDHDALPGAINGMVNNIKPAVLESQSKPGDPLENAIVANVRRGVAKLNGLPPIVGPRVTKGEVKVVGATYDLATGKVTLVE